MGRRRGVIKGTVEKSDGGNEGSGDGVNRICSVTCLSGHSPKDSARNEKCKQGKDCGRGVTCSTSGTKIYCGSDGGTEMCV